MHPIDQPPRPRSWQVPALQSLQAGRLVHSFTDGSSMTFRSGLVSRSDFAMLRSLALFGASATVSEWSGRSGPLPPVMPPSLGQWVALWGLR